MKELFSAFSAAVFYPLISFVLPGLTAISGWFLLSFQFDSFRWVVSHNHTETAFTLMLLSIFLGIVIDDIGMRIESLWLDRRRDARTCGKHHQEWWAYLRKPFAIEPSGRRHLRYLVARLKFELGVPVGFAITALGLWLNSSISFGPRAAVSLIGLCLFAYLLFEAASTHEELGVLRHELLRDNSEIADFKKPVLAEIPNASESA
jgi:hypothetical protein